jgi:hypothetical protein
MTVGHELNSSGSGQNERQNKVSGAEHFQFQK